MDKINLARWRMKSILYTLATLLVIVLSTSIVSADIDIGIVSYYNFVEGSGSVLTDAVQSILNGTLIGSPSWISSPLISQGALRFNGISQYVNLSNYTQLQPTSEISISLWFNTSTHCTSDQYLLRKRSSGYAIWCDDGKIHAFVANSTGTAVVNYSVTLNNSVWHHVGLVRNNTNITLYIDGVARNSSSTSGNIAYSAGAIALGRDGDNNASYFNGSISLVGFWNSTLNPEDMLSLYNNGNGRIYPFSPTVNLNSPADQANSLNSNLTFNASLIPSNGFNNTNATLYVWFSNGTLFNRTTNLVKGNVTNSTIWTLSNFIASDYIWNVQGCFDNSSVFCTFSSSNRTFSHSFFENLVIYNASTYESATETFILNVTIATSISSSSATFYYNGTSYGTSTKTTQGNTTLFSNSLDIPLNNLSRDFYWTLNLDDVLLNTTAQQQNVSNINLTLCGASPQNVPYINFTFKDETDLSSLNASVDLSSWGYYLGSGNVSKTLSFSNASTNPSYGFCFNPPDRTVTISNLTFKYASTNYPQRTYSFTNQDLTNSTTNQVLYLLSSDDGIYSSIQVVSELQSPIAGVTVTIERIIGSSYVVIGQGTTGSDGIVTFWVNPNFEHRITASKTGYATTQVTITPSQSIYSLVLASTGGNASYTAPIPGITYLPLPGPGVIQPGVTNFNLTVNAANADLENCKLELVNATNTSQTLASVTGVTNSSYCFISTIYNVTANQRIFGKISVDTDSTDGFVVIDSDAMWVVIDIDNKAWRGIRSFFEGLSDLSEFGEGEKGEFGRIVTFFFITTLLIGLLIYFTGIELNSPGLTVIILLGIIWIAGVAGFLSIDLNSSNVVNWPEKLSLPIIFTFLAIGYWINQFRRVSE